MVRFEHDEAFDDRDAFEADHTVAREALGEFAIKTGLGNGESPSDLYLTLDEFQQLDHPGLTGSPAVLPSFADLLQAASLRPPESRIFVFDTVEGDEKLYVLDSLADLDRFLELYHSSSDKVIWSEDMNWVVYLTHHQGFYSKEL
ncbi:MAG: hypothetical protein H6619_01010 [Deltaproteobacteria bacterium]|nr:hypothetical protein [Deltaproteobacteria bacterium]